MQHTDEQPPEFWENFYASGQSRWSGRANRSLVDEVAELTPGTALDLGCGQGGDAIWLAARGWAVTATDISATALVVAERNAAEHELAGQITWEQRDLITAPPSGAFDLVTASFLHLADQDDVTAILRAAAESVAVGGTLLVIGHAQSPSHHHAELPSPEQVRDDLALAPQQWELMACELRHYEHSFADEAPVARVDGVVRARRRAAAR